MEGLFSRHDGEVESPSSEAVYLQILEAGEK